ncbi:hypothetical protein PINS_up020164 [Pythium insidiosum]|nr:hypothetical protein PINS_up020164 [Pythium insidiosum]
MFQGQKDMSAWTFLWSTSLCLAVLIIFSYLVRYIHNRDYRQMELNQPFIVDGESREVAALKEAQQGTQPCATCGFTNFMRESFCSVCAAPLGDDKARHKKTKRRNKFAKRAKALAASLSSSSAASDQTAAAAAATAAAAAASTRAERVLRRREWTRKLDVEGRAYWFRDAVPSSSSSVPVMPGFVFQLMPTAAPPTANVTETLQAETAGLRVEYVDAGGANPLMFALGAPLELHDSLGEFLALSEQAFPFKYAELLHRTTLLMEPHKRQMLRMRVHRSFAVEHSTEHLSCVPARNTRIPMNVVFNAAGFLNDNEDAHDNHREWFVLLNDAFARPATGLFVCVNDVDQTYYLNPDSAAALGPDHLNYFFAAGRLTARALLQGDLMALHLATPLLKVLLGQPLSFHDLEHFDPVLYKNLAYLLTHDGVEALELDFAVEERRGGDGNGQGNGNGSGETVVVDLVPNGRHIRVTDANKREYLQRKTQHILVERVAPQLYAFTKGFFDVVPHELLLCFDAEELDYVLCGSDDIDVDEWEKSSRYNQYLYQHPVKRWFWDLVREMPMEYKRRLLHFATGSRRVPIGGFSALTSSDGRIAPFTLQSIELIESHTIRSFSCFNRIELPLYIDKSEFRSNLLGLLAPENYEFACD